ncbi:MAG: hypothetical protein RL318_3117 [Fibrobacterota bacterium]|jgi:TolB-like protein
MRLPTLFLTCASLCLAATPKPVPEKLPQVAIMPLESKGVSAQEADLVTDALASRLQQSGKFSVMERSQVNQILKEQSFQNSGACDNSGCAVEMGKLLSVDRIVVGSVGKIGDAWALNLRLVKVQTGEVMKSASGKQKGKLADAQESLVKDVAAELTGQKSKAWIWWTAGGVAIAGGTAAAILLTQKEPEPTVAPTSGKYTLIWKTNP